MKKLLWKFYIIKWDGYLIVLKKEQGNIYSEIFRAGKGFVRIKIGKLNLALTI